MNDVKVKVEYYTVCVSMTTKVAGWLVNERPNVNVSGIFLKVRMRTSRRGPQVNVTGTFLKDVLWTCAEGPNLNVP